MPGPGAPFDKDPAVQSPFDERAATWDDDPAKVERGRAVAEAVAGAVDLRPDTRLLEYGAGTGLASQALVGRVGPITLADPSEGMRTVMQQKRDDDVFPASTRIWDLDLTRHDTPAERFDLILTVLALHHVQTEDLDRVAAAFAAMLESTGQLCVVDLEEDVEGLFHRDHGDFDGFHGFRHADLAGRLEVAGFTDVAFRPCGELDKHGESFPMFLATAAPPGS